MLAEKLSGGAAADVTYVDDVFSTYLYTGTGSNITIANGIDLSTKGGMVWHKARNASAAPDNHLFDTVRGFTKALVSNATTAQSDYSIYGPSALSNGFSIPGSGGGELNRINDTYASWTFRKAPKFFDVVTYTGTGSARTIAHSLGSAPGCIIVKRTDTTGNWQVYHNGLTSAAYSIQLNLTSAQASATTVWNSTAPTSSVFSVGTDATVNASGGTYVAYLFAHDTSSTGMIQCGSFTTDASGNASVTLGWEPQWLLVKRTNAADDWQIVDAMRGMPLDPASQKILFPNLSGVETTGSGRYPTATGFSWGDYASSTYIYIAIRRPNKPPTSGTQVYNAIARTGTGAAATVTGVGFPADLVHTKSRSNAGYNNVFEDRLRGVTKELASDSTSAEAANATGLLSYTMDGVAFGTDSGGYSGSNVSGQTYINHFFKRAPGFFDVVCYTGTGSNLTVNHNLGVKPELMIMKNRSGTPSGSDANWHVFYNMDSVLFSRMYLNTTGSEVQADYTSAAGLSGAPTTTTFKVDSKIGISTYNYVAYLFATLAGISKVGSYTGNGTSQTINCGFSAGARFILIKRTDSTGDWYVWDSARGIVAANDPHLSLNTTAAEVTTDDSIDPDSTGFIVNQVAATNINVNAATYIYLAIA